MEFTWLLASRHKEEATVRILQENMAREVKASELLGKEPRSHVRQDFSLDTLATTEAGGSITTAEVRKG